MKGLGGFFIRRKLDKDSDKKDIIYRKLLQVVCLNSVIVFKMYRYCNWGGGGLKYIY